MHRDAPDQPPTSFGNGGQSCPALLASIRHATDTECAQQSALKRRRDGALEAAKLLQSRPHSRERAGIGPRVPDHDMATQLWPLQTDKPTLAFGWSLTSACPEPPDDLFMVNGGFRHIAV